MTKTKALMKHARMRAIQRHGIILGPESHKELVRQIQDNVGRFIRKATNRVTIWEVCHDNKFIKVAYDKNRHVIITVLPKDNTEG